MTDQLSLSTQLSQIAHTINAPHERGPRLEAIVEVARNSLPEIDHVGISIAHADGRIETLAATDQVVHDFDNLQYELGEGPCLHAIDAEPVVLVEHARHEQRWPRFIPKAVQLGLRSQLGLRLYIDAKVRGGLNLYSVSCDEIDPETHHMAELFATHAALVLGRVRMEQNLNAALGSRTTIGIALGLLMERYGIDQDTAFAYLTRMSSTAETKLRVVAEQVVAEAEKQTNETA